MTKKASPAEKITIPKFGFAFKLKVVQEIENGLISKNFAAKKYLHLEVLLIIGAKNQEPI